MRTQLQVLLKIVFEQSMTQDNYETSPNFISGLVSKAAGVLPLVDGAQLPGGGTRIVDGYSSFYPVPIGDSGELVLIDGGIDKHAKKLEHFINQRELGLGAIKAVLLTHAHRDHIGAPHSLLNRGADIKVFVSAADGEVLQGQRRGEGKLQILTDRIPGLDAEIPGIEPEIIEDGETISFGDQLKIKALAVPGHTRGSMGFKISGSSDGSNVLYIGDALDLTTNGAKNAAWLLSGDTKTSEQSIIDLTYRMIREGDEIDSVIPAHSGDSSFNNLRAFRAAQKARELRAVNFSARRHTAY